MVGDAAGNRPGDRAARDIDLDYGLIRGIGDINKFSIGRPVGVLHHGALESAGRHTGDVDGLDDGAAGDVHKRELERVAVGHRQRFLVRRKRQLEGRCRQRNGARHLQCHAIDDGQLLAAAVVHEYLAAGRDRHGMGHLAGRQHSERFFGPEIDDDQVAVSLAGHQREAFALRVGGRGRGARGHDGCRDSHHEWPFE